jgi:hypothetical protein
MFFLVTFGFASSTTNFDKPATAMGCSSYSLGACVGDSHPSGAASTVVVGLGRPQTGE